MSAPQVFFKIRRIADGLYFKPKWGETDFHKHGKVYEKPGHARAAWKNNQTTDKREAVELVAFEVTEKFKEPL